MLSRTFALIMTGLLVTLAAVVFWSIWFLGPAALPLAHLLEIYSPSTVGEERQLLQRWVAGSQEGEEALESFVDAHNTGRVQEHNFVGAPDYQLVFSYAQNVWVIDVYGNWLRVLRPNNTGYSVYAPKWEQFREQFITSEIAQAQRVPTGLEESFNRYMEQRVAGDFSSLAGYLVPQSVYQVKQLEDYGRSVGGDGLIKGYDLKEVEPVDGGYRVILRVYSTDPATAWEEEYLALPQGGRFRFSLVKRRQYVTFSP